MKALNLHRQCWVLHMVPFVQPCISPRLVCSFMLQQQSSKTLSFICTHTFIINWKCVGDALFSSAIECQDLNPATNSSTVRSAAGAESISDGGRILLAKVMENFESAIISHSNNPTCFTAAHALCTGPWQAASDVHSQRSTCCRLVTPQCFRICQLLFYLLILFAMTSLFEPSLTTLSDQRAAGLNCTG